MMLQYHDKETELVRKAKLYAFEHHGKQLDDSGKPYVQSHLFQVVCILAQVTSDESILAAGWLHDIIEDTEVTYEDLEKDFGEEIAGLVMEVTYEKDSETGERLFPRLASQKAIVLKFADRLSNISRMECWNEKRKKRYLQKSKFWKS